MKVWAVWRRTDDVYTQVPGTGRVTYEAAERVYRTFGAECDGGHLCIHGYVEPEHVNNDPVLSGKEVS